MAANGGWQGNDQMAKSPVTAMDKVRETEDQDGDRDFRDGVLY